MSTVLTPTAAPEDTPGEELAPTPEPQPVLLTALADLVDNLIERDQQTRDALGDIRATLDAVLKHVAASPTATTPELGYAEIVSLTRQAVAECIPADALAAFVSKGDDALLRHEHIRSCHFPQGIDGNYSGYHPADSTAAVAQLESLRADGVEFLVFPATSLWWLDHYAGFRHELENTARLVSRRDGICRIYDLRPTAGSTSKSAAPKPASRHAERVLDFLNALLPAKARVAIVSKGDPDLITARRFITEHFPREKNGEWTGYHPADSAACLAFFDAARADGVSYFVVPKPSFWWLDHYADFAAHLCAHCRLIAEQRALCTVWSLTLSP